jgi:class 3 adenylate cyclase/CHASE2 domain-containing sensor protein
LIALCVILVVCALRLLQLDFFEQFERISYDMRVREAVKFPAPIATNLGFAFIDEASISFVKTNRSLGYRYGLYWPRHVYGRMVQELTAQRARAVAFDIIFGELRDDHWPVRMADGSLMESDAFFALQMRRAGNVILADPGDVTPPELFSTNALALGDITTDVNKDPDGVLRRAHAFRLQLRWHPVFRQVEADPDFGVDLNRARVEKDWIILPRSNGEEIRIPLDAEGNFELADFVGEKIPPGMAPKAKPYTVDRIWHMGIVLAAQELGLDLRNPEINLDQGTITLHGPAGVSRVIPVDSGGSFYIDWRILPTDPRLFVQPVQTLLMQDRARLDGTNGLPDPWADKLVVVGSTAIGNDLADRGATPLERDTVLVSGYWNVANSILTGHFVQRSPLATDLAIIAILGILTALLTWQLRVPIASGLMVGMMAAYTIFAFVVYVRSRYWLPLFLPLAGAVFMNYVCLLAWRLLFEQADKRRVKSIFSTVVSPKIMDELLKAERLSLGGARREVTVLFADVRGFTEFTDKSQDLATAYVTQNKLSGEAAEAYFDEHARETLRTVNLYLGLVADIIIKQDATLDKFIGDCVMAFWGAPTAHPKHAVACVKAAIEAQRAVSALNHSRSKQNHGLELENMARVSAGLKPKSLLPILLLGTGINTGVVTVGMMGSESTTGVAHGNYTVFGREVNLASRLESLSGRGRILISEATHAHLLREDPALAATCIALPELQKLKGIGAAVKVYEVPWRPPGSTPLPEELSPPGSSDPSANTISLSRDRS